MPSPLRATALIYNTASGLFDRSDLLFALYWTIGLLGLYGYQDFETFDGKFSCFMSKFVFLMVCRLCMKYESMPISISKNIQHIHSLCIILMI